MRKLLLTSLAFVAALAVAQISPLRETQEARAQGQTAAPAACPTRPPERAAARIIGGDEADIRNWPGFVALRWTRTDGQRQAYVCGGTLIDRQWVVTAAHCVHGKTSPDGRGGIAKRAPNGDLLPYRLEVVERSADTTAVDPANVIKPDRVIVHPDFLGVERGADIALIHLSRPAQGPVMRISTSSAADPGGVNETHVWVAGFGLTDAAGDQIESATLDQRVATAGSSTLREVSLPVYDQGRCAARISNFATGPNHVIGYGATITDRQICAGQTDARARPRDSCQGDSGGPLARTGDDGCPILVGLVSYGPGCARPDAPGVYTRVSSYAGWIRQVVPDIRMAAVTAPNAVASLSGMTEALNAIGQAPNVDRSDIDVELSPRADIALGDLRHISINSRRLSGYVIALDIDSAGSVTYLLPNPFTSETPAITAGQPLTLPGPGDSYRFRAVPPAGPGRVVVIVSPDRSLVERLRLSQRSMTPGGTRGFVVESSAGADMLNVADQMLNEGRSGDTATQHAAPRWAVGEAHYTIHE